MCILACIHVMSTAADCLGRPSSSRPLLSFRSAGTETWVGQLRLLFVHTVKGKPRRLALVRWYEQLPASKLRPLEELARMSVLRWASIKRDAQSVDHYDVIDAECILRPVLLQENTLRKDGRHFFHNHLVQRA